MEGDSLLAVLKKAAAGIEKTQEADSSLIERQAGGLPPGADAAGPPRGAAGRGLGGGAGQPRGEPCAAVLHLRVLGRRLSKMSAPATAMKAWSASRVMVERSLAQVLAKAGIRPRGHRPPGPRGRVLPGRRGSGGILLHGRKGVPGALPFHPHHLLARSDLLQRARRHPGRLPDSARAPHRGIPHRRARQAVHPGELRGPRSLPWRRGGPGGCFQEPPELGVRPGDG